MSIRYVKGSRKRIKAGIAFRVHLSTGDHLLGYVAKDDAFLAEGGDWDCFVVYIFRPGDPGRAYTLDDLLVPPLLVSRQAWTYGLFDVSEPVSIKVDHVPDRHCFESLTGWEIGPDMKKTVSDHFTEYCEPCAYSSPCGIHAVTTIDGVVGRICEGGWPEWPDEKGAITRGLPFLSESPFPTRAVMRWHSVNRWRPEHHGAGRMTDVGGTRRPPVIMP